MTSVDHDDSIEIISFQADSTTPVTDPGYISVDCGSPGTDEDRVRVLPPTVPETPPTPKQTRIKGLVMVVATTLILMSLILVGVTLSMSDHIDEMGESIMQCYTLCGYEHDTDIVIVLTRHFEWRM